MSHSQLTHSHTHTLTPCLTDSLSLSLSFFFPLETGVVVASGWLAVCVRCGATHAVALLLCRDTAQRTPFTASGWKKERRRCLRDLPCSERGFQRESLSAARITRTSPVLPLWRTSSLCFISRHASGCMMTQRLCGHPNPRLFNGVTEVQF